MMESGSGGVQRKVAGRKRGSERPSKTPKKPKYSNADPTWDPQGDWIQNSFAGSQRSASRRAATAKRSKIETVSATAASHSVMQGGTTGGMTPPHNKRSKGIEKNVCNLTSTPIDEGLNKEKYASQHHQSFDEGDSVFGDIDMASVETASNTTTSSVRRSRRQVSVPKRFLDSPSPTRKSSAKKRPAKQKETSKRFSQSHPIANLQKGQKGVKVGTGVEELMFDSDDSLFADSALTDSILGSLPVNNLVSQKLFSDSETISNSGKLTKAQDDNSTTTSQISDTNTKRLSIEFRAASGSQLSFEEAEAVRTVELLSPKGSGTIKQDASDKRQGIPEGQTLKVGIVAPATPGIGCGPVSGVTPGSARARLLKDRLRKDQLRKTESTESDSVPVARATRVKAAHVKEALKEAEKERATGTEFDIGPFYGLPSKVAELFQQQRGIKSLYDWQHECLTLDAVRESRNLIYSLPTSGGKTLVAEVLMLKELLCKKKDVLFILPFVAIVQEKVKALTSFAHDLDFVVQEYAASKGSMPPRIRSKRKAVYIATIEKGAGLINSLIEANRINELGLVVIDELHMLGDGSRGAILEMSITKLIHAAVNTQLIGMSATLNNISDLCQFMNAEVYTNNFRPVELKEYVKIEDTVYEINQKALCPDDRLTHSRICMYRYDEAMRKADPDLLSGLVQEVIPNHSCLVFCPTKKNCENVALLLCNLLPRKLTQVKLEARTALLNTLLYEGNGIVCPVLKRTVPYGMAYHHSGLTVDERRLIEEAYLDGTLCLLTCTSTLAAGVNLPAKRVILRAPKVASTFLSRSQYKQMVGRAGRAGLDSSGESIMILEKKDRAQMMNLVSGPCDVCLSSLLGENQKGLRRLLLTTIGLKITPTLESVSAFLQLTLCYVQRNQQETDILSAAQGALQSLVDKELIEQTMEEVTTETDAGPVVSMEYRLDVTRLGRAVYKGSIDIDRGQQLYGDLRQAQSSLVVANYLHLLYLVTPYDMLGFITPDWMTYLDQLARFEEDEMKVVNLIGLSECYISRKASGQRVRKNVDEAVVGRFYLTLILYNLFRQRSIWEVSEIFHVPRGMVQNILNQASTFAACISHFCQELVEFWAYQDLFGNFVKKLSFCFMADIIPLLEIPGVKTGRARQLFNAGYKSLQQVAFAEPDTLVEVIEHLPRRMATIIVTAAKVLLSERVEALQEEAEQMQQPDYPVTSGGSPRCSIPQVLI